jgi:hypothetical protein
MVPVGYGEIGDVPLVGFMIFKKATTSQTLARVSSFSNFKPFKPFVML